MYIPDMTERFPEGIDGVDMTDSYFPDEGLIEKMKWDMWEETERIEREEFEQMKREQEKRKHKIEMNECPCIRCANFYTCENMGTYEECEINNYEYFEPKNNNEDVETNK